MITVSSDPSRKLVLAHMSGFLTLEDVDQFSADEQAAVKAMGLKDGEFYLLIDTSEAIIQMQEVVSAFQHLVTTSPLKAKRIAVSRNSSLTRLQSERILKLRDNTAVFESLAEAEEWLFAD